MHECSSLCLVYGWAFWWVLSCSRGFWSLNARCLSGPHSKTPPPRSRATSWDHRTTKAEKKNQSTHVNTKKTRTMIMNTKLSQLKIWQGHGNRLDKTIQTVPQSLFVLWLRENLRKSLKLVQFSAKPQCVRKDVKKPAKSPLSFATPQLQNGMDHEWCAISL